MSLVDIPAIQTLLEKTPRETNPQDFKRLIEKICSINGNPFDSRYWDALRNSPYWYILGVDKTWKANLTRMHNLIEKEGLSV